MPMPMAMKKTTSDGTMNLSRKSVLAVEQKSESRSHASTLGRLRRRAGGRVVAARGSVVRVARVGAARLQAHNVLVEQRAAVVEDDAKDHERHALGESRRQAADERVHLALARHLVNLLAVHVEEPAAEAPSGQGARLGDVVQVRRAQNPHEVRIEREGCVHDHDGRGAVRLHRVNRCSVRAQADRGEVVIRPMRAAESDNMAEKRTRDGSNTSRSEQNWTNG
eukprot:2293071-Pleurochrysis_carterae.AAC.2